MKGCKAVFAVLFVVCFLSLSKSVFSQDSIPQKEPGYLAVSGGIYSCLDLWASTGYVNVQFLPGKKLWVLQPQVGALVTYLRTVMVYGGLTWPASPVKWLVIQTGAAAGYYESGQGIDLAFPFEFRLTLSVLFKFRNYAQLGVEFAHISNANISPPNPGTESISLIFQLPLRKRKAY